MNPSVGSAFGAPLTQYVAIPMAPDSAADSRDAEVTSEVLPTSENLWSDEDIDALIEGGDGCKRRGSFASVTQIETEISAILRAWTLRSKANAIGDSADDSMSAGAHGHRGHRSASSASVSFDIVDMPTGVTPASSPDKTNAVASPDYPRGLSALVLATHAASLGCQLVGVVSPYVMPDVFARLTGQMVCERVSPSPLPLRVARAASCKVLRIGNAVFTPGTMMAPYFVMLALGDLVCWGTEIRRPGRLQFQGDSLANLVAWVNARGGFSRLLDALDALREPTQAGQDSKTSPESPMRKRFLTGTIDKLRKTLEAHDDPAWQKALATRIRHLSVAIFLMGIARLPFSDDTSSLPDGLLDFYQWLEKASGATKLAAASAESLVTQQTTDGASLNGDGDVRTDSDADLTDIRIDPRLPDLA